MAGIWPFHVKTALTVRQEEDTPQRMAPTAAKPLPASREFKPLIIALISLLIGVVFDYLFYGALVGLSFPLFIALIVGLGYALAWYFRQAIAPHAVWLLIPLGFFAAMVAIRASELLTFLNVVTCLGLLLLLVRTAVSYAPTRFTIVDYIRTLITLPLHFMNDWRVALMTLFGLRTTFRHQRSAPVIKGIVMAVPLLVLFTALFASADLVFRQLITEIIQIEITPDIIGRTILIALVSSAFTGAYGYVFIRQQAKTTSAKKQPGLGAVEASVFLGLLNLLFVVFIGIQLAYLFGGEANITVRGFTYAEYARRGFFELIAAAVIVLGLILLTEKNVSQTSKQLLLRFKAISTLLALQTMVIMASSFMRLSLYEDAYGFTVMRAYSHLFVIYLAIVFGLLLFKLWSRLPEYRLAFAGFIISLLFLAGMNVVNVEGVIARKNIMRYEVVDKLDPYYLGFLSADAVPYTLPLLDRLDQEAKRELSYGLERRREEGVTNSKWQSFNLARSRATKLLAPKAELLQQLRQEGIDAVD